VKRRIIRILEYYGDEEFLSTSLGKRAVKEGMTTSNGDYIREAFLSNLVVTDSVNPPFIDRKEIKKGG
jgi:hypothetical protein